MGPPYSPTSAVGATHADPYLGSAFVFRRRPGRKASGRLHMLTGTSYRIASDSATRSPKRSHHPTRCVRGRARRAWAQSTSPSHGQRPDHEDVAREAALAAAGSHSGRRWNPWDTTSNHEVDTARLGLLRVRYGDSDAPRFPAAQAGSASTESGARGREPSPTSDGPPVVPRRP